MSIVSRPKSAVMIKAERIIKSAAAKKVRPKTSLAPSAKGIDLDADLNAKIKSIEEGNIVLPPEPPELPQMDEDSELSEPEELINGG